MDPQLRDRLADRAFLFDDPNAYLAGVDAALHAVEEQRQQPQPTDAAAPLTAQRRA